MKMSQSQGALPGRQSTGILCDAALNKRSFHIAVFQSGGASLQCHVEAATPIPIHFHPKPKFGNALQFFTARCRRSGMASNDN
jgi:hypothetical protein